jgi:hypothetical protein
VDHELAVMHNTITPFTRVSAEIYDFANRHWYDLHVEGEVEDDEWMERTVRTVEFNTISIDKDKFADEPLRECGPANQRFGAI